MPDYYSLLVQKIREASEHSRPLVIGLETWLREQRAKLSAHSETAKAIANSLNHWSGLLPACHQGVYAKAWRGLWRGSG